MSSTIACSTRNLTSSKHKKKYSFNITFITYQATKHPCLSICLNRPCLLYIHISHYKLLFDIILFKSLQLICSTLFPQTEYCMSTNFPTKNLFILFKKNKYMKFHFKWYFYVSNIERERRDVN